MICVQRFPDIASALSDAMAARFDPCPVAPVRGGCVNECFRWQTNQGPVFVKLAETDRCMSFAAEAAGLNDLRDAGAVRVPRVLGTGLAAGIAYLTLEWIDLIAASGSIEARLGAELARQHRRTAQAFGWHRDNDIGRTAQLNAWMADWPAFFRERRLRPQLDLACRNGYGRNLQSRGDELLARLDAFFGDDRPLPSLLHGDLWAGNWGVDERGTPVIFDPAVYFGDRETDIAMTRLFGGFGHQFYEAYQRNWPLDPSSEARIGLYNLYHLLNHLNMFGRSHLREAESMIEALMLRHLTL